MKLDLRSIQDRETARLWAEKGYRLPGFDVASMRENTLRTPRWVHFGGGNIFRIFLAARMQDLLDRGLADTGIIVGEGFDAEVVEKGYAPYDNLNINVTLKADGTMDKEICASVADAMVCSTQRPEWKRFVKIFTNPSLQMVSFTITEKGYATAPAYVQEDIKRGPENCTTICCMVVSLLYERFKAGAFPIAVVSMDNCSQNGLKLFTGVSTIARTWADMGLVSGQFVDWLCDESKVSFPWSMIDKITPRPDPVVSGMLKADGVEGMDVIVTAKRSYVAAFVNSEECEYLVVEDRFPNGRPALEKAGVYFTDRDTVTKVERMKVCTCLNPLHTAMSVMGCLLGYTKISDEMKDEDIVKYIKRLGYVEGLPVVTDPGILSPKSFIDDVVFKRLPNPFMPDTPQRIATDTSQKLAIRFGETVKAYRENGLPLSDLKVIPVVLASWIRYLLAVDDNGNAFELSPDPLAESAHADIAGIRFGVPLRGGELDRILSREDIWGYDVLKSELRDAVVAAFESMNRGAGAVRATLHKTVEE
ncbi:MAG: mannitol dehydrogenase family protein [Spirochaetales bacterium]|nr:mannitol dehydrogenase family protein [Spirochaetales bacterium]